MDASLTIFWVCMGVQPAGVCMIIPISMKVCPTDKADTGHSAALSETQLWLPL